MSKSKLLDLLKWDDDEIDDWLFEISVEDFRNMVILALKEQDRDTRHGIADNLHRFLCGSAATIAHGTCINYSDPTLKGLK